MKDHPGHLSSLIKLDDPRVHRMITDPRFLARLQRPVGVDRTKDIPYLAGYSTDGRTIYIDRHLKGEWFIKYLLRHEMSEKALIDIFHLDYQQAHHIAEHLEHDLVVSDGISWLAYSKFLDPYIHEDEMEHIKDPPKNLDLTPYEDEREHRMLSQLIHGRHLRSFSEATDLMLRYHDALNPKLWDGFTLNKSVRDKLLFFAMEWSKFTEIPWVLVQDVLMTGGNANFNWTETSDIDVHLLIDRTQLSAGPMTDSYLKAMKELWTAKHSATIMGYPLEPYAQDVREPLPNGQGVYSIQRSEWVVKPVHGNYDFENDPVLQTKVAAYQGSIDRLIASGAGHDDFANLKKKIAAMRGDGIKRYGEFSHENLLFKALRNTGYLQKITDHLKDFEDRALSLT